MKKLTKAQKTAIIAASLAVIGTTFAILYKKGVFKKLPFLKKNKSKENTHVKKPAPSTTIVQTNFTKQKTSSVFNDFIN